MSNDAQAPTGTILDRPQVAVGVVVALTVVGTWFRVVVAGQDLFADELATYWVVTTHGFRGVWDTVASTAEITPPFSFLLSWLTTRLGHSPEMVRLPALVAGIATVPVVWRLGELTVGRRAALLATALTTFSPFMILYSAEARGYGVLMLLLLMSTVALLEAVAGGRRGWWVLYALCVSLAAYTHYTAVFVLAGQLVWALVVHPSSRRTAVLATIVAALAYLPWLPHVKGDMDSPTTEILSDFSPLSLDMVRVTLGHWSVGFPYAFPTTSLRHLPGLVPLLMMAVAVGLGTYGLAVRRRDDLDEVPDVVAAPGPDRATLVLVVGLAAATPVGTLLQSAVSTNVFSVRSLAASWPFLALAVSALVMASVRPTRLVAAALMVTAFVVSAATMLGSEYQRPSYVTMARFADDHDAAVVINGAAFPPGPLTQLEVEESTPEAPVLRLGVPEQLDRPFAIGDPVPEPAEVFERAAAMADGGPIVVISIQVFKDEIDRLIATLPGYEVTGELELNGLYLYDLRAIALERTH